MCQCIDGLLSVQLHPVHPDVVAAGALVAEVVVVDGVNAGEGDEAPRKRASQSSVETSGCQGYRG